MLCFYLRVMGDHLQVKLMCGPSITGQKTGSSGRSIAESKWLQKEELSCRFLSSSLLLSYLWTFSSCFTLQKIANLLRKVFKWITYKMGISPFLNEGEEVFNICKLFLLSKEVFHSFKHSETIISGVLYLKTLFTVLMLYFLFI